MSSSFSAGAAAGTDAAAGALFLFALVKLCDRGSGSSPLVSREPPRSTPRLFGRTVKPFSAIVAAAERLVTPPRNVPEDTRSVERPSGLPEGGETVDCGEPAMEGEPAIALRASAIGFRSSTHGDEPVDCEGDHPVDGEGAVDIDGDPAGAECRHVW